MLTFNVRKLCRIAFGLRGKTSSPRSKPRPIFRPSLEVLEDRTVPSSIWRVGSLGDTGQGSVQNQEGDLRFCMNNAKTGDLINFAVSGTITLTSPLPPINNTQNNIKIDGSGQNVSISGYGAAQGSIFTIQKGVTAEIDNLWIVSGTANNGGGINNNGNLTLKTDYIENNTANQNGGGIYNDYYGTIYMQDVINAHNNAQNGGGIENEGHITSSNSSADNSNFFDDNATNNGGAIDNGGEIELYGDNITYGGAGGNGGGVYNKDVTASFTLHGGNMEWLHAGGWGGAIYNSGTVDLEGTLIEGNSAGANGGGLMLDTGSTTTLNLVTVTGNTAQGYLGKVANGIGYHQNATMNFTGVADNDDPGGNPVLC